MVPTKLIAQASRIQRMKDSVAMKRRRPEFLLFERNKGRIPYLAAPMGILMTFTGTPVAKDLVGQLAVTRSDPIVVANANGPQTQVKTNERE